MPSVQATTTFHSSHISSAEVTKDAKKKFNTKFLSKNNYSIRENLLYGGHKRSFACRPFFFLSVTLSLFHFSIFFFIFNPIVVLSNGKGVTRMISHLKRTVKDRHKKQENASERSQYLQFCLYSSVFVAGSCFLFFKFTPFHFV